MSGLVGVINLDGTPIDPELLGRLTKSLEFRGPDATGIWIAGHVGFGHTMFRTTDQAKSENQPCTLDGRYWITADARIDARGDLIAALVARGEQPLAEATDPELILHAYRAWGDGCLDHLLGDFVFAIWDKNEATLICARDQIGVKPLYYASVQGTFIFSNTLDCIRKHPFVSGRLNEAAVGDFLLFGSKEDSGATTFHDIKQVPPANMLRLRNNAFRISQYWNFPMPGEIAYKDPQEYLDRFTHLVELAVSDRVQSSQASILMSGGMDSTSIAYFANAALRSRPSTEPLRAIMVHHDPGDGNERHFADIAAKSIGIPIHYLDGAKYSHLQRWDSEELRQPEPTAESLLALVFDQYKIAAKSGRVLLTGVDGEALFASSRNRYIAQLLRSGSLAKMAGVGWEYLRTQRRLPAIGLGSLRSNWSRSQTDDGYPTWLNPDFERSLDLRQRWFDGWHRRIPSEYEERRDSFRIFTGSALNNLFISVDPGVTRILVEQRHPFADIRIIKFCMSLPQVPWRVRKFILRTAMGGKLPQSVLNRPKTVFRGRWRVPETYPRLAAELLADPRLRRYVNVQSVPRKSANGQKSSWTDVRPLCLAHWLARQS